MLLPGGLLFVFLGIVIWRDPTGTSRFFGSLQRRTFNIGPFSSEKNDTRRRAITFRVVALGYVIVGGAVATLSVLLGTGILPRSS